MIMLLWKFIHSTEHDFLSKQSLNLHTKSHWSFHRLSHKIQRRPQLQLQSKQQTYTQYTNNKKKRITKHQTKTKTHSSINIKHFSQTSFSPCAFLRALLSCSFSLTLSLYSIFISYCVLLMHVVVIVIVMLHFMLLIFFFYIIATMYAQLTILSLLFGMMLLRVDFFVVYLYAYCSLFQGLNAVHEVLSCNFDVSFGVEFYSSVKLKSRNFATIFSACQIRIFTNSVPQ